MLSNDVCIRLLTMLLEAMYWILRRSMARIMDCIAMKIFWYTNLMNPRLSSSEYPLPWMIRICLMNVDFPDSPVPVVLTDREEEN